jgi:hypothetical protein
VNSLQSGILLLIPSGLLLNIRLFISKRSINSLRGGKKKFHQLGNKIWDLWKHYFRFSYMYR